MEIPSAAFNNAIRIANDYGLNGKKIQLEWIPPATATSDPNGRFIILEKPRNVFDD